MAPFPPTCSAILPMNAKDYFLERDSAPFRALLAEVSSSVAAQSLLFRVIVCCNQGDISVAEQQNCKTS